ncbi:hypothetical protein EMPG_10851, partial [Blastomyces silverae]
SVAQSLIFSSTVLFFTISLSVSVLLQIIADSFILKISVSLISSTVSQIYNYLFLSYIISDQTYENLSRFLISDSHTETHF